MPTWGCGQGGGALASFEVSTNHVLLIIFLFLGCPHSVCALKEPGVAFCGMGRAVEVPGGVRGGGKRRGVLRRRQQLLRKTCALACGDDPNEAFEERQCPEREGAGRAGRGGVGGRGATVLPSHVRDGKGGDKMWAGCNYFFFFERAVLTNNLEYSHALCTNGEEK